jgi:hypothetical protein
VELAAVADDRPVRQPPAPSQLGALPGARIQMTADPGLPGREERLDPGLGMGPAAPGRWWNGDDETDLGIDRDPQMARSRRVTKRVRERRSAQRALPSLRVTTAFSIRR